MDDAERHESFGQLAHLQLLDSALPVGAFAHSFGLEAAVDSGAVDDAESLEHAVRALLHGRWAPVDARVVVLPWALDEGSIDLDELCAAAWTAHLSVPASRSRAATCAIGRRLLQLVPQLHPMLDLSPLAGAIADERCPPLHALVHGWTVRELGVERDRAAEAWLHAAVAACVSAAVRLMSLGQTDAQRVVARMLHEIPTAWAHVRDRPPLELAGFAPLADEWAMRQPRLASRLFMS